MQTGQKHSGQNIFAIDASNIDEIIHTEIGLVFQQVLEDAGVYKCTPEGRNAFMKFVDAVNA